MKFKFSLSLKFAIGLTLTLFLLGFSLTYANLLDQQEYFNQKTNNEFRLYTQSIDNNFGNFSFLKNKSKTSNEIDDFMEKNKRVICFNIILPDENNTFRIFESSNESLIGKIPEKRDDIIKFLYSDRKIIDFKISEYKFLVLYPIHSEELEDKIGAYELTISMEADYKNQQARLSNIINLSAIFISVSLAFFGILIYIIVKKPLSDLKKSAISLGKGDLDTRVNISSRDELGELGYTFNKMAEELKESRGKIEDYNRILEKLLSQKDEFIGQLGHDLKNPLQPLVGLLPMLIDQEKDPKKKETLEVMYENVEYMEDLIFDTLKLAKLRSDNIEFDFEEIDLRELSDKVIKSQRIILEENNIKIENNIENNIFVRADRLRLSEVFKNIINNSIKYTPEKGGKIILNSEKEKNIVRVSIKDTGIGMTKEQVRKVFDEFYKADKQSDDYHSTGLGLAICKRIVEKHNGEIWVESKGKNKGTTFHFTLDQWVKKL